MKRRDWMRAVGAAAVVGPAIQQLGLLTANAADAVVPTRIVDTHTHFYDPSRPQGVPWPGKGTPLYRTVMPGDWHVVAGPMGVKETIVVEASPWVEDNQWVLDIAENEKSIIGLVGNLDPRDADFSKHLSRFAKNPIFRGIRWRSDLVPIDRDREMLVRAANQLEDLDLELDLNGSCQALPLANRLATEVPGLRIVINHLGASGDPQTIHPDWHANIRQLAERPSVFMKVSALVEQVRCEPGQAPANTEYYLPILDHLWQCFGEDRLIYGSNWPVSDRGAPYEVVYKIVGEYFAGKGQAATEKYFWQNAKTAYRWTDRA